MKIKLEMEVIEATSSSQSDRYVLRVIGAGPLFDEYEDRLTKSQKELCSAILNSQAELTANIAKRLTL